jgi:hypothetical protein
MVGYAWLCFCRARGEANITDKEVCLFKHFTNLPCPSCGSTRAVLQLIHGNFHDAFLLNPLGYLIFILLVILPFWIIGDLIASKATLYTFYRKAEGFIRQKFIAIPLIFILVINWMWNIYKGV